MSLGRLLAGVGVAATVASCSGVEARPLASGVVDSTVVRDSAIAQFQRGLPVATSFEGGASSPAQLVRQFVTAVEQRDTAELGSLLLTKSEFGWLYYPSNPEGLPPYNLTPRLMWFMLEGRSSQGYRKLMKQRAGKPLRLISHRCEREASRQGENTVWGPCVVLRQAQGGDMISERLFGQIVERGGRYKFVSYANKL